MDPEVELKKKKPWLFQLCWRCQKLNLPHYDSQAIISAKCTDGSYSGTFHLPLCWSCTSTLHTELPEEFRIL